MEEIIKRPNKAQRQRIAELVEQAKAHHLEVTSALQNALVHAKHCGDILNEIQPLIGFGRWKRWIKKQFTEKGSFSYETAAVYKRIADNWDDPAVLAAREQGIGSIKGLISVIRENQKPTMTHEENREELRAVYIGSGMPEKEVDSQFALDDWKSEMRTSIHNTFARHLREFTFEELWILEGDRFDIYGLWDAFREKVQAVVKQELGYFYDDEAPSHQSKPLTNKEEAKMKQFWNARVKEYKNRKLIEESHICKIDAINLPYTA